MHTLRNLRSLRKERQLTTIQQSLSAIKKVSGSNRLALRNNNVQLPSRMLYCWSLWTYPAEAQTRETLQPLVPGKCSHKEKKEQEDWVIYLQSIYQRLDATTGTDISKKKKKIPKKERKELHFIPRNPSKQDKIYPLGLDTKVILKGRLNQGN